ncbi:MAG: zinc ribbon domain-containing protein [archaeon]|nr:zinc ribbon domain-containing protein [archaeon]
MAKQENDPNVKTKNKMRTIAYLLLIVGAILVGIGGYHSAYSFMNFFDLTSDERSYYTTMSILIAPGMFMILPALFLLSVSNQRKLLKFSIEESGMAFNEASGRALDGFDRMATRGSAATTRGIRNAGGIKIDTGKAEVIKIRCQACGVLNDENAKFCDECGTPI